MRQLYFLGLPSIFSSWRIIDQINFCPFNSCLFSSTLLCRYIFSCTDLFFTPSFLSLGIFPPLPHLIYFHVSKLCFWDYANKNANQSDSFWDDWFCGPLHILLQILKNRSLNPKILFHIRHMIIKEGTCAVQSLEVRSCQFWILITFFKRSAAHPSGKIQCHALFLGVQSQNKRLCWCGVFQNCLVTGAHQGSLPTVTEGKVEFSHSRHSLFDCTCAVASGLDSITLAKASTATASDKNTPLLSKRIYQKWEQLYSSCTLALHPHTAGMAPVGNCSVQVKSP